MTLEQKDLLLKDLSMRLPFGVKVGYDKCACEVLSIDRFHEELTIWKYPGYYPDVNLEDVKPYLFPLSSMTEEQKKDIFHNGKFYIDRHNSLCRFPMYEDDYDFVTMEDCLEIFNKLNKYHFDYRGLIPMGLANDATGLNIY